MQPIPQTVEAVDVLSRYDERPDLLGVLQGLGDQVHAMVPESVGLSLSWARHGVTFTLAASDEEMALFDALQYLEDGPCTRAVTTGHGIATNHEALMDEGAWRDFAGVTAARGIRSTLSFPLTEYGQVVGSANLYAATDSAFEGHHQELADVLGAWAPGAVRNADLAFTTRRTAEFAPATLKAEAVISQAVGMMMARRNIDADTAREQLEDAAMRAGISTSQLASALLSLRP